MKMELEKCPICGGASFVPLLEAKDYFVSGETFVLRRCARCGFVFTAGFPSEQEIGRYYDAPDYISHSDTKQGVVNKLYHIVRAFMLKRKLRLVDGFSSKGALLDVGCGTGYFLDAARKEGWRTLGIEKNEHARLAAIGHFDLDVQPESSLAAFGEGRFDAITLWHVLEHLQDLDGSMDRFRRLLKSDGVLVVALPNCSSYDAAHYGAFWAAYDVPRHLWHFTPDTFGKLAEKHQFRIVKRRRMPFDAFYVSMLSERYKNGNGWRVLVNALWIGTAGFLKSVFDKTKSSSVIYVLKKK